MNLLLFIIYSIKFLIGYILMVATSPFWIPIMIYNDWKKSYGIS